MKIFFATIQLTDWADYPAQNVSVNGQTVFEAVDIVRAAAARFFSRGNDKVTLQFSVRREFSTNVECQKYLLTHFSQLPKSGLCQITCGTPGETSEDVFLSNAVLSASPQGNFNGVEAIVQYTIQAGLATTDIPIDFLIGTGEEMIRSGQTPIGSGVDSVDVVFTEAFATGTIVVPTVSIGKPSGSGSNIFATVRDDTVTVDGFTAELSGPTPDASHKLNWIAIGHL
jgi:hypothetical protein